jgi:hypothetical protein
MTITRFHCPRREYFVGAVSPGYHAQEIAKTRLRHLEVAYPSAQNQKNEGRDGALSHFHFPKIPPPGVAPPEHALGGCPHRRGLAWGAAEPVTSSLGLTVQ